MNNWMISNWHNVQKLLISDVTHRLVKALSTLTTVEAQQKEETNEAVLYVHWPYCARRCSYCNFNKYISTSVNHQRMADCLARETTTLLQLSGVTKINSVFFGGGTPSLALPSTIHRVIQTVKDHVTFTQGSEITLEANPKHLETSRLRDFKSAGINRLSIGVQALVEDDLKLLGRDHSVEEAVRCVEEAENIFPGHVSVDLMFGRPGQSVDAWKQELAQVVDFGVNHVSLYQLTLERGTQLFKWVESGKVTFPDNEDMADMYTTAIQMLEAGSLKQYEVSNFAKEGFESKHNQAYWSGSQYIGVGPGAHGRFVPQNAQTGNHKAQGREARNAQTGNQRTQGREARIQTLEPDNWMIEVEKYGHATRKIVSLSEKDRLEELLCLGLRTKKGVTTEMWCKVTDSCKLNMFEHSKRCEHLFKDGLLKQDENGLQATPDGLLILDSIVPDLLIVLGEACTEYNIT